VVTFEKVSELSQESISRLGNCEPEHSTQDIQDFVRKKQKRPSSDFLHSNNFNSSLKVASNMPLGQKPLFFPRSEGSSRPTVHWAKTSLHWSSWILLAWNQQLKKYRQQRQLPHIYIWLKELINTVKGIWWA
jgi:hypothetical protein